MSELPPAALLEPQPFVGLLEQGRLALGSDPHRALRLAEEAERLVAHSAALPDRAETLAFMAQCQLQLGHPEDAVGNLLKAARLWADVPNPEQQASTLALLARTCFGLGDTEDTRNHLNTVLMICQAHDAPRPEAEAFSLGAKIAYLVDGDLVGAIQQLQRAQELHQRLGDQPEQVKCLINLGIIALEMGDPPKSLEYLLEAHHLARTQLHNEALETTCLINIGNVHGEVQNLPKALEYFELALEVSRQHSDLRNEMLALHNIAEVRSRLDQPAEAAQAFGRLIRLAHSSADTYLECQALDGLGKAQLMLGQAEAALEAHITSLGAAQALGNTLLEAQALISLAQTRMALSEPLEAIHHLAQALQQARRAEHRQLEREAHLGLSDAFSKAGVSARALEHFREYHRLEREVINAEAERRTRNLSIRFDLERARQDAQMYRLRTELVEETNALLEKRVQERTLELEDSWVEMVTRLAAAAEFRDDQTGQHTERVGQLSALIGQELGLPADQVALLRLAARLHDLGKIGIPDLVMLKPGRLTTDEFDHMKHHTLIGGQILAGGRSALLRMAEEIALSHHERWNGQGYPHGLSGQDIPITGRIVAVADVFDALVSERPYKPAWNTRQALEEIGRQAGAQFDPAVVAAFLRLMAHEIDPVNDHLR
jgi:HD-GYP domain-containing protein (c-di-GMP phosphodiesterase class II)